MTTAPTSARTPGPHEWRRASRDSESPIVGGVASGLARHIGVPALWARAAFILAAAFGGLGVFLYARLWVFLPRDSRFATGPPGPESAERGGRRPVRVRRLTDAGPTIALAALG